MMGFFVSGVVHLHKVATLVFCISGLSSVDIYPGLQSKISPC